MSNDDVTELSEGGHPILHHAPRATGVEFVFGNMENIQKIGGHIEAHLGKPDFVYHEIVSDLVHLDVHIIAPRPDRNVYTLITSGMSDRPMTVPPVAKGLEYAELMLCLPPDWPLNEQAMQREESYWPVRWLKTLARLPHEYNTWFSYGHTIPNGDPPEPLASNTRFCGWIVMPPLMASDDFFELSVSSEKTIRFWAIVPLYKEEMDFKVRTNTETLSGKLDEQGITEIIDIKRPNVCKRRLFDFRR